MLEQALGRADEGEADALHDSWVPKRERRGRDPSDDDHDHRRGEDPEADPTAVVAPGVHVVEVVEQAGREHQRDVDDDEEHEPDHHEEVQRARRLDAEHLADALEASRQGGRHAESGHERERGGHEDRDEVREQLQAVVDDPAAFGRPVQRQVLDQHRRGVGKHAPTRGYDAPPLWRREQQDVEDQPVDQPQDIGAQVPPAGQADRMTQTRQPDLCRQADGVLFGGPKWIGRYRSLGAQPLLARRAVAGPVEPRMVREYLEAGPNHEEHQEQVEEVLPSDPRRESGVRRCVRRFDGPGVSLDESLHGRHAAQTFRGRDRDEQEREADWQEPEQVEPLTAANAHSRRDTAGAERDRTRPGRRVDEVLPASQLLPVGANGVRRQIRTSIVVTLSGRVSVDIADRVAIHDRSPHPVRSHSYECSRSRIHSTRSSTSPA